jgi:hypothetical protein
MLMKQFIFKVIINGKYEIFVTANNYDEASKLAINFFEEKHSYFLDGAPISTETSMIIDTSKIINHE